MSSFNPAISGKRKEKDKIKLLMSDYKVTTSENDPYDFIVLFKGPNDSPYESGFFNVRVLLPEQYPYKSPSIGFITKIFHPNIDFASGTVCLDVINQTWSPMFDLINIFDIFLPQLLLYPNPTSPLNTIAATLLIESPEVYQIKVKDHVKKYCIFFDANQNSDHIIYNNLNERNGNTELENDVNEMEEELSPLSSLSQISELSQTSNIELLE